MSRVNARSSAFDAARSGDSLPGARTRLVGLVVAVGILVGSLVASLAYSPGDFPPNFSLTASFVAAALLSVRLTAMVAVSAALQTTTLAWFHDGYRGGAFYGRLAFALLAAAIAVGLAVARSRREEKLRAAQVDLRDADLLRTLTETAADPIFVKDREGRYLLANDATAKALGLERASDIIGRHDRDVVPSEMADWIEADDQRVFRSGGREEFEDTIDNGPARRVYLTHKSALRDAEGVVVGLTAVAKDITVRRAAQRELARSEHRFRSLVEATAAVVWRTNVEFEFIDAQEAWTRYTGQGEHEQDGHGWLRAIHADDRERFLESWRRARAINTPFACDIRLWHAPSRTYRHVSARAIPVEAPDGGVEEWVGTFTDVHDRVVAERRVERVASVRRLVADAAASVAAASAPEQVADEALQVLARHLPRHTGAVVLTEPEDPGRWHVLAFSGARPRLAAEWSDHVPGVRAPIYEVVRTGRPLEFADPDSYKAAYPDMADAIDRAGITGQTFLVPLRSGRKTLGAISLGYQAQVDPDVVQSTRMALDQLAPIVGHSLEQAQFLELEAQIASSFQQAMLELEHEADSRLEVATTYQAGSVLLEAGGDWYDVVNLSDGRIALTVGDVVGRSLRAATVMGRLRAAMRALVLTLGEPAAVLSQLDEVVDTIDGADFATCVCVIVDPARSRLAYSTAGHPPPLLLPATGPARYLEEAQGPPLGVPPSAPRRTVTEELAVGARLVLYTDGLVERRREPLDVGLERLLRAAEAARRMAVSAMPTEITGVLFADYEQQDDVAMICAELISESNETFRRCLDADPATLASIRRSCRHWLTADGAGDDAVRDALLAIGEALANAIEHGAAGPQSIDLELRRSNGGLQATIHDRGHWRDRRVDPNRGRGLRIMHSLAQSMDVDRAPSGTTVNLALPLGAAHDE